MVEISQSFVGVALAGVATTKWVSVLQHSLPDQLPLGMLAVAVHVSRQAQNESQFANIVLSTGLNHWAQSNDRHATLIEALNDAVRRGEITCPDTEAFAINFSASYQYVMAHYLNGTASPELAECSMFQFAQQLGYAKKQFNEAVKCLDAELLLTSISNND